MPGRKSGTVTRMIANNTTQSDFTRSSFVAMGETAEAGVYLLIDSTFGFNNNWLTFAFLKNRNIAVL